MNISRDFFKILTVLVITLSPLTHTQADNMSISSITFLNKVYSPAWTSEPTPGYSDYNGAVYLPEGETPPYYTNALSVDQDIGTSVADAVQYFLEIARPEVLDTDSNMLDQIENLETGNTLLLFAFNEHDEERAVITNSNGRKMLDMIEAPDAGEVFLVLVSNEHDKNRDEVIWAWQVYRYSPMQTADGKQGIRRLGYTRQHYGSESASLFLEAIDVSNPRSEIINAVIAAQIP